MEETNALPGISQPVNQELEVTGPSLHMEDRGFPGMSQENWETTEGDKEEKNGQGDRSHIIETIQTAKNVVCLQKWDSCRSAIL